MKRTFFVSLITILFIAPANSTEWTAVSANHHAKFFVNEKESVFIPVRTIHRIENFYKKPVKIMEAQIGSVLKESDIVRYKDIYGRIN